MFDAPKIAGHVLQQPHVVVDVDVIVKEVVLSVLVERVEDDVEILDDVTVDVVDDDVVDDDVVCDVDV